MRAIRFFSLFSRAAAVLLVVGVVTAASAEQTVTEQQVEALLFPDSAIEALSDPDPEKRLTQRLQAFPGSCRPFCSDLIDTRLDELRVSVNEQLERSVTPQASQAWSLYLAVLKLLQGDLVLLAGISDVLTTVFLTVFLVKRRIRQWRHRKRRRKPRTFVRQEPFIDLTALHPEPAPGANVPPVQRIQPSPHPDLPPMAGSPQTETADPHDEGPPTRKIPGNHLLRRLITPIRPTDWPAGLMHRFASLRPLQWPGRNPPCHCPNDPTTRNRDHTATDRDQGLAEGAEQERKPPDPHIFHCHRQPTPARRTETKQRSTTRRKPSKRRRKNGRR